VADESKNLVSVILPKSSLFILAGAFQLGGELGTWQINLRLQLRQVALRRLGRNRRRSVSRCGCSELIRPAKLAPKVKCTHARSAVGLYALPLGIPVEIEMIVEVE